MPKLSNVDWIIVTDIIYKMNSAKSVEELQENFVKSMLSAFTFDAASFFLEEDLKSDTPDPYLYNISEEQLKEYTNLRHKDYLSWTYALSESTVVRESDVFSEEDRKANTYIQNVNMALGNWAHGVSLSLFYDKKLLASITFHNSDISGDFPDTSVSILEVLKTHLALALNKLVGTVAVEDKLPEAGELIKSHGLTPREAETVMLLLSAKSNEEVCQTLSISPNTLKNHQQNIYKKLKIHNRVELFAMFMK